MVSYDLDQTMCTDLCPCDVDLRDNWRLFFSVKETSKNGLNKWKRTTREIPTRKQRV